MTKTQELVALLKRNKEGFGFLEPAAQQLLRDNEDSVIVLESAPLDKLRWVAKSADFSNATVYRFAPEFEPLYGGLRVPLGCDFLDPDRCAPGGFRRGVDCAVNFPGNPPMSERCAGHRCSDCIAGGNHPQHLFRLIADLAVGPVVLNHYETKHENNPGMYGSLFIPRGCDLLDPGLTRPGTGCDCSVDTGFGNPPVISKCQGITCEMCIAHRSNTGELADYIAFKTKDISYDMDQLPTKAKLLYMIQVLTENLRIKDGLLKEQSNNDGDKDS